MESKDPLEALDHLEHILSEVFPDFKRSLKNKASVCAEAKKEINDEIQSKRGSFS